VLLYFQHNVDRPRNIEAFAGYAQCLVDRGHGRFFELHIDRRPGNLNDFAYVFCHKFTFL
jgi:hypothetical protein